MLFVTTAADRATSAEVGTAGSRRARPELLGGRYALGDRLGEGGMGVVYRARDTVLHRTVAVKVFRDGTADAARTTGETHILAGLNHPALVTLFDAHVGADAPRYLVMEYVEGPTLDERLTAGALSAKTVALMAQDLGEALHTVHNAGIVHRDIKPANVLLRTSTVPGEEYRAKLADFGIAYLVDTTRLTAPGTVVGSVAYLSPEQVRGAEPAAAADVYSLGLLLLEALTGKRGFPQTSVHEAAVVRLTQDPLIPPSVSGEWAELIRRMTSREPAQRPTARELVSLVAGLDDAQHTPKRQDVATAPLDRGETAGSTLELAMTRTAPIEREPAAGRTVAMDSPEQTAPSTDVSTGGARNALWRVVAAAVLVTVIVALAVAVIAFGVAGSPDAPVPTLPALEEPVNTHIQQLLDAVSP